jgi:hypothetical protein
VAGFRRSTAAGELGTVALLCARGGGALGTAAALQGARAGARAQGRLGLPFMGARARAPGRGAGQAGCGGRARMGPAGPRLGQRGQAGRTGSGLRARPVRIGFVFFSFFFPEIFSSAYEIPEKVQKIR